MAAAAAAALEADFESSVLATLGEPCSSEPCWSHFRFEAMVEQMYVDGVVDPCLCKGIFDPLCKARNLLNSHSYKDEAAYGCHQEQISRHLHRKYCTTSCPLREGILLNVMFREEVERPNLPHHGKAQATVNLKRPNKYHDVGKQEAIPGSIDYMEGFFDLTEYPCKTGRTKALAPVWRPPWVFLVFPFSLVQLVVEVLIRVCTLIQLIR